jgi:hypothetical protein
MGCIACVLDCLDMGMEWLIGKGQCFSFSRIALMDLHIRWEVVIVKTIVVYNMLFER